MQEVMERPERRRREGQRSVGFAFGRRSSLFCVPVLFLYLCLLWVYVFYGFYVGPAKLQRGATPPSVMVLSLIWNTKLGIFLLMLMDSKIGDSLFLLFMGSGKNKKSWHRHCDQKSLSSLTWSRRGCFEAGECWKRKVSCISGLLFSFTT